MSDNSGAVGIDLGTSRCFAAVNRRDGIVTVSLDNTGERQLPSYVSFKEAEPLCGQIVVNRLSRDSKSTVFDSKRIIGRKFNEIQIDPNWPFEIAENAENAVIRIQTSDGDIYKTPEEVASVLLKQIKKKVEAFQGRQLDRVVITVPTGFNEKQKYGTVTAAEMAGWNHVELLPEPIAAALAYFVKRPIPNQFTMLVFDFGGGTLDVSIMKVSEGCLQKLESGGDATLGGRDFDNLIFHHFSSVLKNQYSIDVTAKDKLKYCLVQNCMEIKHTLSVQREDA